MRVPGPDGNSNAPVVTTNLPGIGLAVAARAFGDGIWNQWQKGMSFPRITTLPPFTAVPGVVPLGGQVSFALVKLDARQQSGEINSSGQMWVTAMINGTPHSNSVHYQISPITISPATCSTPNVAVDMGTVPAGRFNGVGTTATPKPFAIKLNNCPYGIKSVKYQLDPMTSIVDPDRSVIALQPGGATGIGLQLTDNNGNPIPLGQPVAFSGYKPWPDGKFQISLQAAYYQTGTSVTAGPANTSVRFTMTYE